jgi:hypothetical protein
MTDNTKSFLVGDEDIKRWGRTTVVVAFEVEGLSPADAEAAVDERLNGVRLLMTNDSNDYPRATADPIRTWATLPLRKILDEAL